MCAQRARERLLGGCRFSVVKALFLDLFLLVSFDRNRKFDLLQGLIPFPE